MIHGLFWSYLDYTSHDGVIVDASDAFEDILPELLSLRPEVTDLFPVQLSSGL